MMMPLKIFEGFYSIIFGTLEKDISQKLAELDDILKKDNILENKEDLYLLEYILNLADKIYLKPRYNLSDTIQHNVIVILSKLNNKIKNLYLEIFNKFSVSKITGNDEATDLNEIISYNNKLLTKITSYNNKFFERLCRDKCVALNSDEISDVKCIIKSSIFYHIIFKSLLINEKSKITNYIKLNQTAQKSINSDISNLTQQYKDKLAVITEIPNTISTVEKNLQIIKNTGLPDKNFISKLRFKEPFKQYQDEQDSIHYFINTAEGKYNNYTTAYKIYQKDSQVMKKAQDNLIYYLERKVLSTLKNPELTQIHALNEITKRANELCNEKFQDQYITLKQENGVYSINVHFDQIQIDPIQNSGENPVTRGGCVIA